MTYKHNLAAVTVIYKGTARLVLYSYNYSASVGSIRKEDALAVMRGDAVAVYSHRMELDFTSAKYYPGAKKWFLKSNRSRPTSA
jgi:hypothetical protein